MDAGVARGAATNAAAWFANSLDISICSAMCSVWLGEGKSLARLAYTCLS